MKYTVVLLRPDYIADDYGKDIYIAHVEAINPDDAIIEAQRQAWAADIYDGTNGEDGDPNDYALSVMFEGHLDAVRIGILS